MSQSRTRFNVTGWQAYHDAAVAPAKAFIVNSPHASIHRLSIWPRSRQIGEALNEVRRGINRALPEGYKEGIQFGMIVKGKVGPGLTIANLWRSSEDLF